MTYDKTDKTTEIMTKIGIIACKNRGFLVEYSGAIMDVDSFFCFEKRAMPIAIPEERGVCYVTLI